MNRSKASAEPKPLGQFSNFGEFSSFCRKTLHGHERFWYVSPKGEKMPLRLEDALHTIEKTQKFLGAPEPCGNITLDDGRRFVARFNVLSLTQHLRWACGLDGDSNFHGKALASVVWPFAAQAWFWSNGGVAPDGMSGTWEEFCAKHKDAQPEKVSVLIDIAIPDENERIAGRVKR